ncbi:N-acetylglutaminylglutamine synthetase [Methyloceanibacter sp. wino2]|uniref:N-acetylglutaminylglutamine synthetase n=1 Tax=Methyloceanibacter sp. wino2 TaxID=2170729 RepID=UPI000D3E0314|nr:N-acetylglutaminylglutamine synthetase [Methyloceanibacter sp. wino2]
MSTEKSSVEGATENGAPHGTTPRADLSPRGGPQSNVAFDCGWGRLLFGQTFASASDLADCLRAEGPGRRDIAFYILDPHVVLAAAPQELFLDPSHTYRLDLKTYEPSTTAPRGFQIRRLDSLQDAEEINRIYAARRMVTVAPNFFWENRDSEAITYFVAVDNKTKTIVGTVTGVDHNAAFGDPEKGSSLWCLAVDTQSTLPGIGEALVRRLSEHFKERGCSYMDLSVLYDNKLAIALYEKLGFIRWATFTVKRKNVINEQLFTETSDEYDALNPYARIIVDEAQRRGIAAEIIDAEGGFFRLTYGGRSVACRESLTALTTAIAMSICDDKRVTRRIVSAAGVRVPEQITVDDEDTARAFMGRYGSIVVKPARGEQGKGIAVGLTNWDDTKAAIDYAKTLCNEVILEEFVQGVDLRIVVINYRVVAAAIRKPATIIGNGKSTVRELIERQTKRRLAATGGESSIPMDTETERCLAAAGYTYDDIPEPDASIAVRKTANLHTGGTIHDVTGILHRTLIDAAVNAAKAIEIPVTGIDFIVKTPTEPDYWFIEANERPGLANHEPQPTAARFIDLLFPQTVPATVRKALQM